MVGLVLFRSAIVTVMRLILRMCPSCKRLGWHLSDVMKRESTLCHSFVNLRTHLEFCTRPLNWANVTHRRRSLVPDVLEQHMAQKLESFRPPHRKELMARKQALIQGPKDHDGP